MDTSNQIKYFIIILFAFVFGVVLGGLYTKMRFLEAGYIISETKDVAK